MLGKCPQGRSRKSSWHFSIYDSSLLYDGEVAHAHTLSIHIIHRCYFLLAFISSWGWTRTPSRSPMWVQNPRDLGHFLQLSHMPQQGAGRAVEQLRPESLRQHWPRVCSHKQILPVRITSSSLNLFFGSLDICCSFICHLDLVDILKVYVMPYLSLFI